MTALQRNPDDVQKKLQADGVHSVSDVARRFLGDVRTAPLVLDLNPQLAPTGAIASGLVVTLPSKAQVRAFARKHGMALGFDERRGNGTDARRRWAALQGQGAAAAPSVSPVDLARSLLARGISPGETGRRVHKQCPGADLGALASHNSAGADPRLAQALQIAEAHQLHPVALSRLSLARGLLETTLRAGGFRRLCEALARDAEAGRAILGGLCVAPALTDALVTGSPALASALHRARAIAAEERGVRDALLVREPELGPLVSAIADGVEPFAGDRLDALGVRAEHDALAAHFRKLIDALRQAADAMQRAPVEVARALGCGTDASRLPRPWPLVCRVVAFLAQRARAVAAPALDDGLGGLVPMRTRRASVEGAPVVVSLAELRSRAAGCARADDEGEAFAARLSASVTSLFDGLRPPPAIDGGSPNTRKARRRAAFELAVTARGQVTGKGVEALVDDALQAARAAGIGHADRLRPQQIEALRHAARELEGPLSIARRPMSELGRALVLVAMATEPDLAQGLARPTGREAFVQTARRHAGRVLSHAACALA